MVRASRILTILNRRNNCKFPSPKSYKTIDTRTLATPITWLPSLTRRISSKLNPTIIRRQNWWVTSSKIWKGRRIGNSYQQEGAPAILKARKVWMSRLIRWPKCYTASLAKTLWILSHSISLKGCKWRRPSISSRIRKLMSEHRSSLLCRLNQRRMVDLWRTHSKVRQERPEQVALTTTLLHFSLHKIIDIASKMAWSQRPILNHHYLRLTPHKGLCENKNIMNQCKWILN